MFKKFCIISILTLMPTLCFAWNQKPNLPIDACSAQIPYGKPTSSSDRAVIVECHTAYIIGYSIEAKIPDWVAYTLTPEHAIGCLARSNAFATDINLPTDVRSTPNDYAHSGFDKGHNANDADMSWDQQVQNESFLMSNMSPQTPALNRGIWKVLETTVRAWTYGNKVSYTIYAGNIYDSAALTIGVNHVTVPSYLYKIVINDSTHDVQAYIFRNLKDDQGADISKFLTNITSIETLTGITFPVPEGVDKNTKASAPWPVDLHVLSQDKKTECKLPN